MIISFSELLKWDTCKRQYYYSFKLGLRPREESEPISIGNKGHALLQTFYTALQDGQTKQQAIDATHHKAKQMLSEKFVDKSLLTAWTLVNNYIKSLDISSQTVLVENRFLFPATSLLTYPDDVDLNDVQFGFTPDVAFERKGNFIDVEDFKFTQRAWSKSKLNRFVQVKLYYIFLKRMGYNVSRSTVRFFNTKTGNIDAHNSELKPGEEETIIRDFLETAREVARYRRETHPDEFSITRRTMNYTACQFCHFEFPCTLEAQGKNASKTLDAEYVKSNYDYSK